jgi:hypothetical protein
MFELETGTPGAKILPFQRNEFDESETLLVHFTLATDDAALRQEVNTLLTEALRPMRTTHGHKIVFVVTNENVAMKAAQIQELAAHVIPVVMRRLGLPS